MDVPRHLFTDGFNSFWHFFFGITAIKYKWIIPLFIIYQLYDYKDKNLFVDITEFLLGYLVIYLIIIYKKKKQDDKKNNIRANDIYSNNKYYLIV